VFPFVSYMSMFSSIVGGGAAGAADHFLLPGAEMPVSPEMRILFEKWLACVIFRTTSLTVCHPPPPTPPLPESLHSEGNGRGLGAAPGTPAATLKATKARSLERSPAGTSGGKVDKEDGSDNKFRAHRTQSWAAKDAAIAEEVVDIV